MNKEKQIEEMAFDLCKIDTCKHLPQEDCINTYCPLCEAEALYNAGYRKQSDIEQLVNEIFDEVEKCVIGTIEPSFIQLRDKYIAKMKGGE